MRTGVKVSFRIPKKAASILEDIKSQGNTVNFDLDTKENKLSLSAELYDFPVFADDGDWEEIDNFTKGVEWYGKYRI